MNGNDRWKRKLFSKMVLMVLVCFMAICPGLAKEASSAVETVLRSTPLYGTNGLAIDNDDHLVIACINPKAIVVMDTDTGKILKTYRHPTLISGPDDVTIAKDGTIYYTDIFSGNVGKISPAGEISLVMKLLPWVNSIRLSPDETKLYVGHCIGDDRMTEIDLKTGKSRIVAEKVGWPNSSSFGPDGRYYSPLNIKNEYIRWNLETGERETIVTVPTFPSSVKFDAQGRMLLTEFMTGTITRYDMKTKERKVIAKEITIGLDNIAIDSKGRMFTASNHSGGIMEVFEDGSTKALSPEGLLVPSDVSIVQTSEGEQLMVADHWNVRFFDTRNFKQTRHLPSGFYPWVIPPKDLGGDLEKKYGKMRNLSLPFTVSSADGKTLIISSWQSDCINVFDLQADRVVRTINGNRPIYAMQFGDNLVASELMTRSVVAIAPDGTRKTLAASMDMFKKPAKPSSLPIWFQKMVVGIVSVFDDGLVYPAGMAAQGNNLWVAEWYRGQILQVVADGKVLSKPKVVASGLEEPEGIAVAKDGSLLAVESKIGRLVKIDPASGKKTVLADHLKTGEHPAFLAAPSYYFSGVTVGADGAIYVSCDEGREVVRVKE